MVTGRPSSCFMFSKLNQVCSLSSLPSSPFPPAPPPPGGGAAPLDVTVDPAEAGGGAALVAFWVPACARGFFLTALWSAALPSAASGTSPRERAAAAAEEEPPKDLAKSRDASSTAATDP